MELEDSVSSDSIFRIVIGCYLNGYNDIVLKSSNIFTVKQQQAIRNVVKSLYLRILASNASSVSLQTLMNESMANLLDGIERMHLITIDQRIQGQMESGDLIPAIRKRIITWDNVIELGQIVAGRVPGRGSDEQLTLFESLGIAAEDVAVARCVYDNACREGAGTPLIDSILGC